MGSIWGLVRILFGWYFRILGLEGVIGNMVEKREW